MLQQQHQSSERQVFKVKIDQAPIKIQS